MRLGWASPHPGIGLVAGRVSTSHGGRMNFLIRFGRTISQVGKFFIYIKDTKNIPKCQCRFSSHTNSSLAS